MTPCRAPLALERLLEYWTGEVPEHESERIEAHVFTCGHCAAQLDQLAAIAHGLTTLVRQGRLTGIIPYQLLNRLGRDGVRVRYYSVAPGQSVPCAAWPEDELFVVALRANLAGVQAVSLVVTGLDGAEIGRALDVPVSPGSHEVLHATAGTVVRQMPSMRIHFTLTEAGPEQRVLGEYVLEHSSTSEKS
jgi:hypothetical protein